jgi:hypothetical protein
MKKIITLVLAVSLLFSIAPQRLYATTTEDIISDAQIASIRSHCTELLATLGRIRQADTLLRYDRGQIYRSIVDKLMVPLNQRVASNQLDGSELVATTAKYNAEYQLFFDAYRTYDASLAATLAIDCTKQPTTFYDKLAIARQERSKLHDSSVKLIVLAKQYRTQFDSFKASVVINNKQEAN